MTSLNIAHNKLKSRKVQGGAFRQSRSLENIDIQDNELHRVPSLPKNVVSLNLRGEKLFGVLKNITMRLRQQF